MTDRAFVQLAYFVPDIHAAAEYWAAQRGAGPFLVMENIPLDNAVYRGNDARLDHSSAYGQLGDVMIELVQQNDPGPSAFRDMYDEGEQGLHHMAQFAQNLEEEINRYQSEGFECCFQASAGEVGFAFIDTRSALGHMVELYQDCEAIRGFYDLVRNLSTNKTPGQIFSHLPE